VDAIKIVTPDKKIARETAAIVQRIARRLGQLERFPLTFRHFRSVDDRGGRPFRLRRFGTGFLGDLFLGRFERRFHVTGLRGRDSVMSSGVETSLTINMPLPLEKQ